MSQAPVQDPGRRQADVPRHLDVVAFARDGATLQGSEPLSHYPRVQAECVAPAEPPASLIDWRATGRLENGAGGSETWLDLQLQTTLILPCQRCLEPMSLPLRVERSFRFVGDEATAQRLDDEIEDDVLVAAYPFDLHELVEDELLMAIPPSPRHDRCPVQPAMHAETADFEPDVADRPHPFAALQALKDKR